MLLIQALTSDTHAGSVCGDLNATLCIREVLMAPSLAASPPSCDLDGRLVMAGAMISASKSRARQGGPGEVPIQGKSGQLWWPCWASLA